MTVTNILKYNSLVPRYTSYPTAPHFDQEFNVNIYKEWLAKIDSSNSISLYIHIPFCRKLCWFCGCNTKITEKYSPLERYLPVLINEIKLLASYLPSKTKISQIHFGGGSPNILVAADFDFLMCNIKDLFAVQDDAEIAIEIDPRHITADQAKAYAKHGVNRSSIGVQDFNLETQQAINRVQPYEMVKEAIDLLKEYNIKNINLDFIYGLPKQTISNMQRNIELSLALDPSRLSIFGYAHVPWMKKHMRLIHESDIPDDVTRLKIFQTAESELEKSGYNSIGIDHFAKKDDHLAKAYKQKLLRRNFQGYVSDNASSLIGVGTSSIGHIGNMGYVQNHSLTNKYQDFIANKELPVVKGKAFTKADLLHYDIIMQLMCYLEVDLKDFFAKHNVNEAYFADYLADLKPFIADELVIVDNYKITIYPHAKQIVRVICSIFDQYYQKNKTKHSTNV